MQDKVEPALRGALEAATAPATKLRLVEALLWLHLPKQPVVTPALLRGVVHTAAASSLMPGYAGSHAASLCH